jgi:hypothetical protein
MYGKISIYFVTVQSAKLTNCHEVVLATLDACLAMAKPLLIRLFEVVQSPPMTKKLKAKGYRVVKSLS